MMLARILDAPIQASKKSNNEELQNKLQVIKSQLFSKPLSNQKAIEFGQEDKPKSLMQAQQDHLDNLRKEAMSDEEEGEESFYDDEDDDQVEQQNIEDLVQKMVEVPQLDPDFVAQQIQEACLEEFINKKLGPKGPPKS